MQRRCKIDQTRHLNDAVTTSPTRKTSPYVLIHDREPGSTTPPSDRSVMCWKDHNGTHYSVASANNPHRTRLYYAFCLRWQKTGEMPPPLSPAIAVTYRQAA